MLIAATADVQTLISVASSEFEKKLEDRLPSDKQWLDTFAELVGDAIALCNELYDLDWDDELAAFFPIVQSFMHIVQRGCLTKAFLDQSDTSAWEFGPEEIMNRLENLQDCALLRGRCDFGFLETVVAPKMHTIKVQMQRGPWAALIEAKDSCDNFLTTESEEEKGRAAKKLILTSIHHIFYPLPFLPLLVLVTWSSFQCDIMHS